MTVSDGISPSPKGGRSRLGSSLSSPLHLVANKHQQYGRGGQRHGRLIVQPDLSFLVQLDEYLNTIGHQLSPLTIVIIVTDR